MLSVIVLGSDLLSPLFSNGFAISRPASISLSCLADSFSAAGRGIPAPDLLNPPLLKGSICASCSNCAGRCACTCGAPDGGLLLNALLFWNGFVIPRSTSNSTLPCSSRSGGGSSKISALLPTGADVGAFCGLREGLLGASAIPPLAGRGLRRSGREGEACDALGVDWVTKRLSCCAAAGGGVRASAPGRLVGGGASRSILAEQRSSIWDLLVRYWIVLVMRN